MNYEQFKTEWLVDIQNGNPTTVELGGRFARKILSQWIDINEDDFEINDLTICDGTGDGGIDVAFLVEGDTIEDGSPAGNTWY